MQEPDSITFDRSKPLYRIFTLEDGQEWWTVEADNTPGRQLNAMESDVADNMVMRAPWRAAFFEALGKNGKATVYANIVKPYVVPDGVDAILRNAIIEEWAGDRVATGAIYGDRRQRWKDGHPIHTSIILSGPDDAGIIKTRNSTYLLEMRAGG
jgi:hypothetical protein